MARILLIDDDDFFRPILLEALTRKGHTVAEARNGEEGLGLFHDGRVDLVITDILMPEKDGFEVLIALRKMTPRPKVIAMSGDGRDVSSAYLKTAKRLGATKVLQKPFSRQDLIAAVEEVLGAANTAPDELVDPNALDPV